LNTFEQQQILFHESADPARFRNRRENPFIRAKERTLACCIARHMAHHPAAGRILEIGCGEGNNLEYVQKRLPDATLVGLDFSLEKTAFMKHAFPFPLPICGNALNLPFRDASFDLVLLRDLLHHVDWAREKAVAEAVRVLKTGGSIVIFESDGRTPLNRLFQFFFPAEKGLANSNPNSLRSLGIQFGAFSLRCVEGSFLLRGLGFCLGWRKGYLSPLFFFLYALGWHWELFVEMFLPKRWGTYWMLTIRPKGLFPVSQGE